MSDKRVEISSDFIGETNFDATIRVYYDAEARNKKKNFVLHEPKPIASDTIHDAIKGLDDILSKVKTFGLTGSRDRGGFNIDGTADSSAIAIEKKKKKSRIPRGEPTKERIDTITASLADISNFNSEFVDMSKYLEQNTSLGKIEYASSNSTGYHGNNNISSNSCHHSQFQGDGSFALLDGTIKKTRERINDFKKKMEDKENEDRIVGEIQMQKKTRHPKLEKLPNIKKTVPPSAAQIDDGKENQEDSEEMKMRRQQINEMKVAMLLEKSNKRVAMYKLQKQRVEEDERERIEQERIAREKRDIDSKESRKVKLMHAMKQTEDRLRLIREQEEAMEQARLKVR